MNVKTLVELLENASLPETASKLREESSSLAQEGIDNVPWSQPEYETDDIAAMVADELAEQVRKAPPPFTLNLHSTTDLINSMREGVWATIPPRAQEDFVFAEKNLLDGDFRTAAQMLGLCVETTYKEFYRQLISEANMDINWHEMENALFS